MNTYFQQTDYPETIMGIDGNQSIAEGGSFLVAQANWLKYMDLGHDVTPVDLDNFYRQNQTYGWQGREVRDYLRWNSLTKFDPTISVVDVKPGWPTKGVPIVRFHHMSVSKPYNYIGQPNYVDHYCVMIDPNNHIIIDSYDGQVKEAAPYGDPIGYAEYTTPELRTPTQTKPEQIYTLTTEDIGRFYEVCRRLGFTAQEMIEHNNISDPNELKPGYQLHLPIARDLPNKSDIRYQPLTDEFGVPERREMHVQAIGGAHKWSFADVKTWDDISRIGAYPYGTNLTIAGIAYVPVTDDDGVKKEVPYLMDSVSFGDFVTTGKVRYTVGFVPDNLILGKREVKLPEPLPKPKPEPEPEPIVEPELLPDPPPEPEPAPERQTMIEPERVVANVTPERLALFNVPAGQHGHDPRGTYLLVHRADGNGIAGRLYHNWHGTIDTTEVDNGIEYAIVGKQGAEWRLPLDFLDTEKDVYNTEVDMSDRAVAGRLTFIESLFTEPLYRAVHNPRYKRWAKRYNKKRSK